MSRGPVKLAAAFLFVLGGLWILTTGGCCEAVFGAMGLKQKFNAELILTFPGCIMCLAAISLVLNRYVSAAIILIYAGMLSVFWSQTAFGPGGNLASLITCNAPSVGLAFWAGIMLLTHKGRQQTGDPPQAEAPK